MKKCRQVRFIQGTDLNDLENKINQALLDGAELGGIDIPSFRCALIVTEYVGEIKKTLLDELEEAFGRHTCEECPFFKENTDKRCKWHKCTKTGQKVMKTKSCCADFYRKEKDEIPENQGKNEGVRLQGRGRRGLAEGIPSSGLRPFQWSEQIPAPGMRIPFDIPQDPGGRIVQGGLT